MSRQLMTEANGALEHAARFGRRDTISSVSLAAPVLGIAELALAFGSDMRMSWRDRDGLLCATRGVVATVTARGEHRFADTRSGVQELFGRVAGTKPRLVGGFAFEPGGADSDPWRGFGDARFDLPRVHYESDGERAQVSVFVLNPLDPHARRDALTELGEVSAMLAEVAANPTASEPRATAALTSEDSDAPRRRYMALVSRARDLCQGGDFAKIVVARSARLGSRGRVDLAGLLARLDQAYGDCYVLTAAGDDGGDSSNVLVAASPERLVRVRGTRVETAALAGTVAIDHASDLLSDAKLQLEHQLTADAIADALERSGCVGVSVARPILRRLRHLVHLETAIAAQRRPGAHVFDIAAALHPTPAVAGIPAVQARRFVRESEADERGWYAGLVGWCDAAGDGEFAVALRAGLIEDRSITLFAGAGIVGDSDPATEWAETQLKVAALKSRLLSEDRG